MRTILALCFLVVGVVGTWYTLGQTSPVEGSLIFPVAIILGALLLLTSKRRP